MTERAWDVMLLSRVRRGAHAAEATEKCLVGAVEDSPPPDDEFDNLAFAHSYSCTSSAFRSRRFARYDGLSFNRASS